MEEQNNYVKKVETYLNNNNIKYIENSLKYKGVRESMKQIDGSLKTMQVVSFLASVSSQAIDSDVFYYVYIDDKTGKLDYIMGPQSIEKIDS